MMRVAKDVYNRPVFAIDGEIGTLYEFYFEDRSWQIPCLVVESGSWLNSRRILISPRALSAFDGVHLRVNLTKDEIAGCAGSETDIPFSLQVREKAELLSAMSRSTGVEDSGTGAVLFPLPIDYQMGKESGWNPHLRSSTTVAAYGLVAQDGAGGIVEDLLLDDKELSKNKFPI